MKILIDFGASRIKSTISDKDNYVLSNFFETPGSSFNDFKGSIKFDFFKRSILKHIDHFSENGNVQIDEILACGEMHGFGLIPISNNYSSNNQYLKEFYSWRYCHIDSKESLKKLEKYDLYHKTCMTLREGLPSVNLYSIVNKIGYDHSIFEDELKLISFPQVLSDDKTEYVNRSIAHSMGIYSLKNTVVEPFSSLKKIKFPTVIDDKRSKLGTILHSNKKIPITCFIGDLQAACLGSDLKDNELLLNIGTGSQIISIYDGAYTFGKELRPYFKNKLLECITHIPAGRHFTSWCEYITRNNKSISKNDFWKILKGLEYEEILEATRKIDFFFDNNININVDSKSDLKDFLANLTKSFLHQYLDIIQKYSDNYKKIKISGGIINRIPSSKRYLSERLNKEISIMENSEILTLIGLREMLSFQNET